MNTTVSEKKIGINQFFSKVYGILALGIGISAFVSYLVLDVFFYEVATFISNYPFAYWGFVLAELGVVFFLSSRAHKGVGLTTVGFIVYSILNGITLAIIISTYTSATVVAAFTSAAATFAGMSVVGMVIKKDLSAIGHACLSALIGIIIAMLLNIFVLHSNVVDFFVAILIVLVFSGLTAYDNQMIKKVYYETGGQVNFGVVVLMALNLYLDFINLFLAFLRIFSKD